MKERVRFAVGAASMVLAACCLMGALFTAWLRCAAGAVTQAAGWAVMQQLDLKEQPWAAGTGLQAAGTGLQAGGTPHRVTLAVEPGSLRGNEGLLDQAALGAPPGTEIEQPGDKSQ